ncbi:MAG TPA: FimV/HubP family polar landmark protein [Steroidobacteraceae bacterium]|jgi:pilus assembly protein FimV|nr:FimV/HubP family polar landmark protein [Steroidobacteraceae bacterium]
MLMMALAMPGASHALGLGEMHVDSALNERLAAEIDLVGATAAELNDLRAAVANRETFLRYGADRPAFLASATFKVAHDSRGRPVLSVRSTEPFTEPLVNFLVDLHWRNGELVREYTLLLDPPGFAAAAAATAMAATAPSAPGAPSLPAAPAAATPILERKIQTVARQVDPPSHRPNARGERSARKMTRITVGARATLRGIAWRVGERSPSDLQKMMIAIFRANPSAFDGNINRLHLGAVLAIPTDAQVGAISPEEAKREFHVQMAAWHSPERALHASTPGAADAAPASKTPETEELNRRVQSLEHELAEVQGLLVNQHDKIVDVQQQVALVEKTAPVATIAAAPVVDTPVVDAPGTDVPSVVAPSADEAPSPAESQHASLVPVIGGFGLLAGALASLYLRFRRRTPKPGEARSDTGAATPAATLTDEPLAAAERTRAVVKPQALDDTARAQPQAQGHNEIHSAAPVNIDVDFDFETQESPALMSEDDTHPMIPVPAALIMPKRVNNAAATISRPDTDHTTLNMAMETMKLPVNAESTRVDATRLDYNLVDLDMTAQHVHMPSVLNEQVVVKERRTNLADVLRLAIEREPDRHDLRMKLLELYYSAAATNRQAFLEVVQKFARDRDYLQAEEWDKIAFMGRQIASDNPLFAEPSADDDDLADCA